MGRGRDEREGEEISKKEQNYIVGGSKRNELEKKKYQCSKF